MVFIWKFQEWSLKSFMVLLTTLIKRLTWFFFHWKSNKNTEGKFDAIYWSVVRPQRVKCFTSVSEKFPPTEIKISPTDLNTICLPLPLLRHCWSPVHLQFTFQYLKCLFLGSYSRYINWTHHCNKKERQCFILSIKHCIQSILGSVVFLMKLEMC